MGAVVCGCNSMVEYLPSKQATWVRFPSPASDSGTGRRPESELKSDAAVAQSVERVLGKDEVLGSNPSGSFEVGYARVSRVSRRWSGRGHGGFPPALLGNAETALSMVEHR